MSAGATIPTTAEYREVVLAAGEADYIVFWKRVDNYLYGLTNGSPAKLIKINKDNFDDRTVITFASDGLHRNAVGLTYATATGVLYALFAGDELVVTEVTLELVVTNKIVDSILTVFSGGECLATDDTYLFVLFKEEGMDPVSKIKRYVLADLRADNVETLALTRCGDALVVAGPLYVIKLTGTAPQLLQIAVEDFTQASFDFPAGTSVEDGDFLTATNSHLFVSFREVTGKLYRFNLATLALDVITTGVASNHVGLVFDGIHLWDLLENGTAIRIDPITLEQRAYAVNHGQGYINEISGDGVYLYASFFQVSTKIARYYIAHTATADLQLVGFLPSVGEAYDVLVSGNYAYVASGTFGLVVIDISDPDAPVLVGTVDRPFGGSKIAISGPIACVTGARSFHSSPGVSTSVGVFYIINITDPANPWLMGSIEDGYFYGAAIVGDYAYAARGLGGMSVIDISNRGQPTIVASSDTPGLAQSVALNGNYAYVADGQAGLRILDVSNPRAPTSVGSIDTPGNAQDVTVVGSLAYVADLQDFQIVDMSNPQAPSLRGGLAISAFDVKIQNGIAYVAAGSAGIVAVDIANPDNPIQLGSLAAFGALSPLTGGMFLVSNLAYLANGDGGLGIANISNPAAMSQVSNLRSWFSGLKLTTKPGLAIITGTSFSNGGLTSVSGLRVIDIANPAAPFAIGQLDDPSVTFYGLAVSGNCVYVACGFDGVKVIDISNPALPAIIGSYDTPGGAQAVSVAGNYAYVADGSSGLRILDVSNPETPLNVGWVDTPGNARDVTVEGAFAYVADLSSLQIINVSNPATPTTSGSLILSAAEVKVANGIAYVAAASSGLVAVDVSNPASPSRLGSLRPTGAFNPTTASVAISGSTAYVANGSGGLAIIDVSNPASLRLINTAPTLGYTRNVIVDGRWAYLADSLAGINIFDVGA